MLSTLMLKRWVAVLSAVAVLAVAAASVASAQSGGDCYAGLVVGPGESCTYPGTTQEFWVDDSGRGHFVIFTAGTGIDARNTTINGVTYNFKASKQADGTWLIETAGTTTTTTEASTRFSDVPPDHYAHDAIEWAAEVGVTAGYPDGTFKPEQPLKRRHAVIFMERYYDEILGADESEDFTRGDMMQVLYEIAGKPGSQDEETAVPWSVPRPEGRTANGRCAVYLVFGIYQWEQCAWDATPNPEMSEAEAKDLIAKVWAETNARDKLDEPPKLVLLACGDGVACYADEDHTIYVPPNRILWGDVLHETAHALVSVERAKYPCDAWTEWLPIGCGHGGLFRCAADALYVRYAGLESAGVCGEAPDIDPGNWNLLTTTWASETATTYSAGSIKAANPDFTIWVACEEWIHDSAGERLTVALALPMDADGVPPTIQHRFSDDDEFTTSRWGLELDIASAVYLQDDIETWLDRLSEADSLEIHVHYSGDPSPTRLVFESGGSFVVDHVRTVCRDVSTQSLQRFPDVPPDHYAHDAIEWAAEVGVTAGYLDGTFKPERPLKRRHAVIFTERYYDEILEADESADFTRADMMVLLKAINDGTALPDEDVSVTMARANWQSGYFQAEVYKLLLEELGFEVSNPADMELSPSSAYQAMAQGDIDFWVNSWYPSHLPWLQSELPDGSQVEDHVTTVGEEMIAGGLLGFLVSKSFADEYGVYTIDALNRDADALAAFDATDAVPGNGVADIFGCPEAWPCNDIIESQIAFSGWNNIAQVQAGYEAMFAQALDNADDGLPMVIFTWTPSAYITQLRPGDNVYWMGVESVIDDSNPLGLEGGEDLSQRGPDGQPANAKLGPELCPAAADAADGLCQLGWIAADILVTANNDFLAANPAAEALFEAVMLSVIDVSLASVAQSYGEDPRDIAVQWIADNRNLVDEWIAAALAAA